MAQSAKGSAEGKGSAENKGVGDKQAAGAAPASSLPGGASSLQETFEDWVVACVQQGAEKKCSQAQVQTNGQTRERILSIELAPKGDVVEGLLVLPFGLALEKGVTLLADEEPKGMDLRFRTCLPLGCIVPVSFDAAKLGELRKAATLKLKVTTDGGQEAVFAVSMKGFGAALDRTTGLMK